MNLQPHLSTESIDRAITHLHHRKPAWAEVTIAERLDYLHRCMDGIVDVAAEWATAACQHKGIDPASNLAGEEWIAGPLATLLNIRLLIQALAAEGQPQPISVVERSNGQSVARVFPDNLQDRLLWLGFEGEIWIEPEQAPTQGQIYRQDSAQNPVELELVLAAGNISSIAAMDTLYKLFAENRLVLLKTNPVNAYVGRFLERAFEPLIRDGFLQIVDGGADVGAYLCQHPQIDRIHITGSHHTHDAIVWGSTPAEQQQRKAERNPVLAKPITSELGCVTPIIVVPGDWSDRDIAFQARNVASAIVHNASFNCVAAKVLVTAKGWQHRDRFLARLRQELKNIPSRQAYYPGAQARYQAFLDRYPQSQALGERTDNIVPWTLISDVPAVAGEYALTTEAFCGVIAEVSLDATNAGEFLDRAVPFVNDDVWGNLSCMLLVDPQTQGQYRTELDRAIADLRYGAIAINAWTGMTFLLASMPWGAFPGNPLTDITSGCGVVHNTYLFDRPQKSVLRAPFRIIATPIWFANHQNLLQLAQRYLALVYRPSWAKFFSVVLAALKG